MQFRVDVAPPTFLYTTRAVGRPPMTLLEDTTDALIGSFDPAIFNHGGTSATVELDHDRWIAVVNDTLTVDTTALWRRVCDLHMIGRYDDTQVRIIHNILNLLCFGFTFDNSYKAPILVTHGGDVSECDVMTFFRTFARDYGTLCGEDVFFVPSDVDLDSFSMITDPTSVIIEPVPTQNIWEWDWPVDADGNIGDYNE